MATKTFKIGLSATDKQNMAQDIYERLLDLTFAEYDSSETYNTGDFVVYNDVLYQCKEDNVTGTWDSSKWEQATLQDLLDDIENAVSQVNDKANVDGNYPTMTVGNADQLNSTVFVTDKVPYLFRTSGGDADIGNREYDKIIGGSLVVNQLVQNGNFESSDGWTFDSASYSLSVANNVATLTALIDLGTNDIKNTLTRNINEVPNEHKTLVFFQIKTTNNVGVRIREPFLSSFQTITPTSSKMLFSVLGSASASTGNTRFQTQTRNVANGTIIEISEINTIDITKMFGSTIADYIYSLEQANAGSGVAWFRNYLQEEYYPYNTGAIKNVKLVSHDMVGFNQWDEETILVSSDTRIRNKNNIRVLPNATYCFTVNRDANRGYPDVEIYDINGNKIGSTLYLTDVANDGKQTFTTPENAYRIRFTMSTAYGTTYTNDICINLSWSGWRNGQYEQYQKNSYPLDTNIDLRGFPKLDSNNNLYFDGDEYSSDGKVVRKYDRHTFNGNEVWTFDEGGQFWYVNNLLPNDKLEANSTNCICSNGIVFRLLNNRAPRVYLSSNPQITSSTNMNQVFPSGTTMDYELATPVEESATPFQEPQIVDDFGTEEYVVPTQDGWQIPVGHDTKYPANLRDKLQRLPDMPSVSQNVTETYVVNYNGTTKKCTFVAIDTWLATNGWIKLTDISGYDATKTQTLKNVNGTLTWVDDE